MNRSLLFLLFLLTGLFPANAQKPPETIAEKTKGMKILDGFFPFYWDETKGKLWLEISRPGTEFLYVNALATGVGSNDIGLDRGQLGQERVVRFERIGNKVLLMQPNYGYRALSDNALEKRSVEEAFAKSVLWGFTVEAEENGKMLVDLTAFLLQDAHGVAETLRRSGQGTYRVDDSRSALYMERTRNFPKNTEFEALITFTGTGAGPLLSSVTPTAGAVSVRMHHSFIELPDNQYKPLKNDPRSGFFDVRFADYASAISEPLHKNWVARHRLVKKVQGEMNGEAAKPIVYYLDNGTPEPIRSALLDGARWWTAAFEAAGFKNAFRVEILPDEADPLDIRYNVIQWVHRSTRGWSYGATVTDPRTGEIIKGHVSLGSLRVRQDYLLFQGITAPFDEKFDALAVDPIKEAALARIRQLAAHEVGHTLGLAHNFAASVNNRSSVMDYPHPFIELDKNGNPNLSKVYGTGIGEWDIQAIKWGYSDFAGKQDPVAAREAVLEETIRKGLRYLSDADVRPTSGAHPENHQWDNGSDAVTELDRIMQLRANALQRFGETAIREGAPMTTLHDVLVPVYLMHRYQVEAAVKFVGGQYYAYNTRGDGQTGPKPVASADQKRALESLLKTVHPDQLKISEKLVSLIPPRAPGLWDPRELFKGKTGVTFDPISAAAASADVLFSALLHPSRLERVLQQQAVRNVVFGAENVQEMVNQALFGTPFSNSYDRMVQATAGAVFFERLLESAASAQSTPQVKGWTSQWAEDILESLEKTKSKSNTPERARLTSWVKSEFARFKENPKAFERVESEVPPGAPIGSCDF